MRTREASAHSHDKSCSYSQKQEPELPVCVVTESAATQGRHAICSEYTCMNLSEVLGPRSGWYSHMKLNICMWSFQSDVKQQQQD